MRTWRLGEEVLRDLGYGGRQMRRHPGLTATIVLSLALGIGANTAIFSLVHAMLLRDLPITDSDGLLAVQYVEPKGELPKALEHSHSGRSSADSQGRTVGLSISWPTYCYIRDHARVLDPVVGYVPLGMFDRPVAVVGTEALFVEGDMVTAEYFRTAGVAPIRGRAFSKGDERPDAPRVTVIGERFWERAFGRRADIVGRTLTLNGVPLTVIGVAPSTFTGFISGRTTEVWVQMGPRPGLMPWGGRAEGPPEMVYAAPDRWWLESVVRVKRGATLEQARTEIDRLFRKSLLVNLAAAPPVDRMPRAVLAPAVRALRDSSIGRRYATSLNILMGVGGLVLLIACANVATLLLARATARRKEMGVRLAIGAARWRLVRQMLVESMLYAVAGAGLGLLVARWAGPALLVLLAQGRDPLVLDVTLDPKVLGFAAAVSLLTTCLFGLAPALRATRLDVATDLREQAAAGSGEPGTTRFRSGKLLVAAQIAMSLPIVLGAGLFVRTLINLQGQPLGFDPERMLTFTIDPTKAGLRNERLLAAFAAIQERLRALPGVRGATASRLGLITGWVNNTTASLEEDRPGTDPRTRRLHWNQVADGFFETMGMTILVGRTIDARDLAAGAEVAVVNEAMVKQFYPGQYPIGKRFYLGRNRTGAPVEIVGVVRDAKYASLRQSAPPTAYLPFTAKRGALSAMCFQVRTDGNPLSLVSAVRQAVADVVPGVPIDAVKTQARVIADSLGQETMYVRLFGFFGFLALLLACVGLYGTLAYTLARRTREIGIRMALGAARGRVVASVLSEALSVALVGMVGGGFLAWAGARFVRSLLFEVTPFDGVTVVVAVGLMVLVTLGAGYLPARRAARIEPLRALRTE